PPEGGRYIFNETIFNGTIFNGTIFNGTIFNGTILNGTILNGTGPRAGSGHRHRLERPVSRPTSAWSAAMAGRRSRSGASGGSAGANDGQPRRNPLPRARRAQRSRDVCRPPSRDR